METKDLYIDQAIAWVESHGFEEIRTKFCSDVAYKTPVSYDRQQDEEEFIPDLTAKRIVSKSYFEIILKTKEVNRLISKLKLMGVLAARREGKLYLMVPKGHYQFAKTIVDDNQIMGKIVKL